MTPKTWRSRKAQPLAESYFPWGRRQLPRWLLGLVRVLISESGFLPSQTTARFHFCGHSGRTIFHLPGGHGAVYSGSTIEQWRKRFKSFSDTES